MLLKQQLQLLRLVLCCTRLGKIFFINYSTIFYIRCDGFSVVLLSTFGFSDPGSLCYVIFADRVLGASNFLLAPLELGFFGGGLSLSTFAVILRFFGMGFSTENSYVPKSLLYLLLSLLTSSKCLLLTIMEAGSKCVICGSQRRFVVSWKTQLLK